MFWLGNPYLHASGDILIIKLCQSQLKCNCPYRKIYFFSVQNFFLICALYFDL